MTPWGLVGGEKEIKLEPARGGSMVPMILIVSNQTTCEGIAHHQDSAPQTWLVELQLAHSGTLNVNCILGAQKKMPLKSELNGPIDPLVGGKKRVWL
jgi:hypothetical protein